MNNNNNHHSNSTNNNKINNNNNKVKQYLVSLICREIPTKKIAIPGAIKSIPADPVEPITEQKQTVTKTNNNNTIKGRSLSYTRKTPRKKNPQRKEIRKQMEIDLAMDKLYDQTCIEFEREAVGQDNEPSISVENSNSEENQPLQALMERKKDDDSINDERAVNQLYDQRCMEAANKSAIQDDKASNSETKVIARR
mmetsp:Transcript_46725/g.50405  ORF Transcript_46725/g.50405 Transcript_46725/m.50405 type:complete len:196 (+) Transcript_46725:137-724(+)